MYFVAKKTMGPGPSTYLKLCSRYNATPGIYRGVRFLHVDGPFLHVDCRFWHVDGLFHFYFTIFVLYNFEAGMAGNISADRFCMSTARQHKKL